MPEDSESKSGARETGTKAIAAVVGASIGGVPGAAVAVALEPVFLHLAAESWEELSNLRRRSAGFLMQTASEQVGGDPKNLTDKAFETEGKAQLLADALQAAVSTSNEQKIRALGRALANGISGDDAKVDEERLVIAGLAGLEAPHIRALANLPRQRPRPTGSPTSSATSTAGRRGARSYVLAEAAGLSLEGVTNVLAELVRTGMASQDTYAAGRRQDRLVMDVHAEVAKLQWLADNPGKKPPSNRRPKPLKKPGAPVEPGYERTPFGERCLDYLDSLPDDKQIELADALREVSDEDSPV